jgi:hypothetical protein
MLGPSGEMPLDRVRAGRTERLRIDWVEGLAEIRELVKQEHGLPLCDVQRRDIASAAKKALQSAAGLASLFHGHCLWSFA